MLSSLSCCLFYALHNSFLADCDPFFRLSFNLNIYVYLFLPECSAPVLCEAGFGLVRLHNSFVLASRNLRDRWEDIWTWDVALGKWLWLIRTIIITIPPWWSHMCRDLGAPLTAFNKLNGSLYSNAICLLLPWCSPTGGEAWARRLCNSAMKDL